MSQFNTDGFISSRCTERGSILFSTQVDNDFFSLGLHCFKMNQDSRAVQQLLLQSSAPHDPSEMTQKFWFGPPETVENIMLFFV